MWHCTKCGEQIDDAFDACWKCGTAQDGTVNANFQAEPSDPEVPDPGPGPQPGKEIAEDSVAGSADLKDERIVELCSAADTVEVYGLRILLEEAGIQSRVVGELLDSAAGSLPLGETTVPRIWVRQGDKGRAREIIEEWRRQPRQQWSEPVEGDEPSDADDADTVRFRWLSRSLAIVGAACMLYGAVQASYGWMTLRKYRGTAEGVLVAWEPHVSRHNSRPPEIPLQRRPSPLSVRFEVKYAFLVDSEIYYSVHSVAHSGDIYSPVHIGDICDYRVPIHYDPHHPQKNVVGPLARPWVVLVSAGGIGAILVLIGYVLRQIGAYGHGTPR